MMEKMRKKQIYFQYSYSRIIDGYGYQIVFADGAALPIEHFFHYGRAVSDLELSDM